MSDTIASEPASSKQSDMMLWIAGAAVVGIGATWLLLSSPWSSSTTPDLTPAAADAPPPAASERGPADASSPAGPSAAGSSLDNPLRLAQLAYDAGMLLEPEEYSAWTLFARALETDATSEAARQGLERVAADLLNRAEVALEQGRYDDAQATSERILATLPEHAGALALAARVEAARPAPARRAPVVEAREPEPVARPETTPANRPAIADEEPPEPSVDRVAPLHESFETSLAENRLLTPADDNARYYVEQMLAEDPEDPRTVADRDLLVTELMGRSTQALEALDWDAARTWIDQAEALDADPAAIGALREQLTDRLIAMEGARPIAASDLTLEKYVAPEYPRIALSRGTEGWVDVEFTVGADGTTRDVRVADASNERLFRDEAVAAVAQWRFEPRIFMDRPIDQRSYTRLRFVLN